MNNEQELIRREFEAMYASEGGAVDFTRTSDGYASPHVHAAYQGWAKGAGTRLNSERRLLELSIIAGQAPIISELLDALRPCSAMTSLEGVKAVIAALVSRLELAQERSRVSSNRHVHAMQQEQQEFEDRHGQAMRDGQTVRERAEEFKASVGSDDRS